jgi:hypothetical protein
LRRPGNSKWHVLIQIYHEWGAACAQEHLIAGIGVKESQYPSCKNILAGAQQYINSVSSGLLVTTWSIETKHWPMCGVKLHSYKHPGEATDVKL